MAGSGLVRAADSRLVVVDVQEKLAPAIDASARVVAGVTWLVQVAQRLGVPVAATEQYPKGLGRTVAPLRALLPPEAIGEKLAFSAAEDGCLDALPGAGRTQAVLVGMEAHVCVLQTALGLAAAGCEVFVVADAVGSRAPADLALALERMRAGGIAIVTREMVAFEWLHAAGSERFRAISREFLRA